MKPYDVVIVGGGISGVSLGAEIAGEASVLILEMEDVAGYHATGRSVAFWEESYGGPLVQPLTSASGPMLRAPDPDFSERGFLLPRGALHIGRAGDAPARDTLVAALGERVRLEPVDPAAHVPGLRPDWTIGLREASCCDIDVAALYQACQARFRKLGGTIRIAAPLLRARREGDSWRIETTDGPIDAAVLVNAAGAWADPVAAACGVAPIGITPLRRTVVQLRVPDLPSPDLPLIMGLAGDFYFKPEGAGRVWLTPHDEVPSVPCDAVPEELAVAQAIARFEAAVDWPVAAVERKWAGLRSFSPDRAPVYGFDPDVPGFFWFAGQGGFGFQTAPAAAMLGGALLTGSAPSPLLAGIDASLYAPERFR